MCPPTKGPAVQIKKSKQMYTVVLEYANGITRTVKIKANSRETAEDRARKFHPHAIGVKHHA